MTADKLERCGMYLPQMLDFRDMPSHLFITSNWLCSVQITDDHCSPLERAHALRAVDTFLLSPGNDQVTSIILLSGWEASNVLVEMRCLSKHAPQRATQAEEFFAQLCHLSDTGKSMCACRVGYPKLPRAEHRAVRKLFNGSCDYSLSECAEVVKFLGLLQPRSAYNFASHQWNEQQSQRLWEALRDQKVLSRNGFVKEVPDVDAKLREAELCFKDGSGLASPPADSDFNRAQKSCRNCARIHETPITGSRGALGPLNLV